MSQQNVAETAFDPGEDEVAPQSYIAELNPKRSREPSEPQSGVVVAASAIETDAPAAHQLVRALVAAGVDTFFGIPGGPVSPVFDAILRVKGARLIESRHETSAAFAAADYYRASGRTPAVVVTAGPGATNVVTGVVSAH